MSSQEHFADYFHLHLSAYGITQNIDNTFPVFLPMPHPPSSATVPLLSSIRMCYTGKQPDHSRVCVSCISVKYERYLSGLAVSSRGRMRCFFEGAERSTHTSRTPTKQTSARGKRNSGGKERRQSKASRGGKSTGKKHRADKSEEQAQEIKKKPRQ